MAKKRFLVDLITFHKALQNGLKTIRSNIFPEFGNRSERRKNYLNLLITLNRKEKEKGK